MRETEGARVAAWAFCLETVKAVLEINRLVRKSPTVCDNGQFGQLDRRRLER